MRDRRWDTKVTEWGTGLLRQALMSGQWSQLCYHQERSSVTPSTPRSSPQMAKHVLLLTALLNSFVCDYALRSTCRRTCTMFFVYQLPVPRLTEKDAAFWPIVERAARLICTTPEFDDLAKEIFGRDGRRAVRHPRWTRRRRVLHGTPIRSSAGNSGRNSTA